MPFLSLPPEIQDIIFGLVLKPDEEYDYDNQSVSEAMNARQVCKIFQDEIERQIAILPLARLKEVFNGGGDEQGKWIMEFIHSRVPCTPVRPDARQDLNRFIDRVIDRLLQRDFVPDGMGLDALRSTCKHQLIQNLSLTSGSGCEALLRDEFSHRSDLRYESYTPDLGDWTEDTDVEYRKSVNAGCLRHHDMLIAAVAVGNELAFIHYTDRIRNFEVEGKVFGLVWTAAVLADRIEMLEFLIACTPPFPYFPNGSIEFWKTSKYAAEIEPIWEALCVACSHGNVTAGKMLMDLLSRDDILKHTAVKFYSEGIFGYCMEAVGIPLLNYLIMHVSHADDVTLYKALMDDFVSKACRNGRVKTMRYLLEHRHVTANKKRLDDNESNFIDEEAEEHTETDSDGETYWDEDMQSDWDIAEEPLVKAAEGCQIEALELPLEYSGRIPPSSELLRAVIHYGITGHRYETITFLLEHGAMFDSDMGELVSHVGLKSVHQRPQITADTAMTMIGLLQAYIHMPEDSRGIFYYRGEEAVEKVIQRVLDRGPELPHAPVEFVELGKDCLNWLAGSEWESEWYRMKWD